MAKRGRGITLPAQARHSRTRKVGDTLVLAEGFTVDPRQGQRPLAGLRGSVADSSPSRHGDHERDDVPIASGMRRAVKLSRRDERLANL